MSFGPLELTIVLVIVLLLFGTSKLKSLGSDLGSAIKGFRTAVTDDKEIKAVTDSSEEAEPTMQETEQNESKPG